MATRDFQASWVDIYNRIGGWSKKHSSHPIRAGGGSAEWHSFIRIPDAVREALNSSTGSTTLSMRIYVTNGSSEIDIGNANHNNPRSTGASGLPQYSYNETWRNIGTGWQTYGMSNWFMPRVADGTVRNIILYSFNGQFSLTANGIGQSTYVRFRVTGDWGPDESLLPSEITRFDDFSLIEGQQRSIRLELDERTSGVNHLITLRVMGRDVRSWFGSDIDSSGRVWTSISQTNQMLEDMVNHSWTNARLRVVTRENGTNKVVGTRDAYAFALVHSSMGASINSRSVSESVSQIENAIGKYVRGQSRLNVSMDTSVGGFATIIKRQISVNGQTFNGNSGRTEVLRNAGEQTIRFEVEDSRGLTDVRETTINVLEYSPPRLIEFEVGRLEGENVGIYRKLNWHTLEGLNDLTVQIQSKLRSETIWQTVDTETLTSGNIDSTKVLTGYSEINAYDFRIIAEDKLSNSIVAESPIGTADTSHSYAPKGFAAGMIYDEDLGGAFQSADGAHFLGSADIQDDLEVGGDITVGGQKVQTEEISGWIPINLVNGWTHNSPAAYRIDRGRVWLKGRIDGREASNDFPTNLPSQVRPDVIKRFPITVWNNGHYLGTMRVQTDGNMSIQDTNRGILHLDGISWEI